MDWIVGPLFEADPVIFFIVYPVSRKVETKQEVWWCLRLRVVRAGIKTVVMGTKWRLVRFIRIEILVLIC